MKRRGEERRGEGRACDGRTARQAAGAGPRGSLEVELESFMFRHSCLQGLQRQQHTLSLSPATTLMLRVEFGPTSAPRPQRNRDREGGDGKARLDYCSGRIGLGS